MHSLFSSLKWILIILAFLAWLGVCLSNLQTASGLVLVPSVIEFEGVPLAVTLLVPFVLAFLVLFAVGLLDQTDHFLTERELRKQIRDLEAEVAQLRNLPIREGLLNRRAVDQENGA